MHGERMRIAIGIVAGMTLMILGHILGWPYIHWLFTRIEVATHPDCKPRYWTSHAGVITREPWT